MIDTQVKTTGVSASLQQRIVAAVLAGSVGFFMILGIGFAQPAEIHNAAHDSRHSFTFPCH